jgi:hypothetical protein
MKLSREIFWDVNYDTIDWEKNYQWVICRVLDRGSLQDWKEVKRHYGTQKMLEAAKQARYLSKKTVYTLSAIFNIPLAEFRCYTLMQSQPEQWIY